MEERGWCLDRQNDPDAMHMMVSPRHLGIVDEFLEDLRWAAENAGESADRKARYS